MGGVIWTAQPCGCTQEVYNGQKREKVCEHGYIYVSEKAKASTPGSSMSRSQPDRDWTDARAKVELEGRCRVCGSSYGLEAAHVMGRKYDQPLHSGTKTLYVNPLDIVPLGPVCHRRFDAHELDLLPYLAPEEQVRAVELAGSIETAFRRLAPSAYREVVSA